MMHCTNVIPDRWIGITPCLQRMDKTFQKRRCRSRIEVIRPSSQLKVTCEHRVLLEVVFLARDSTAECKGTFLCGDLNHVERPVFHVRRGRGSPLSSGTPHSWRLCIRAKCGADPEPGAVTCAL